MELPKFHLPELTLDNVRHLAQAQFGLSYVA